MNSGAPSALNPGVYDADHNAGSSVDTVTSTRHACPSGSAPPQPPPGRARITAGDCGRVGVGALLERIVQGRQRGILTVLALERHRDQVIGERRILRQER